MAGGDSQSEFLILPQIFKKSCIKTEKAKAEIIIDNAEVF